MMNGKEPLYIGKPNISHDPKISTQTKYNKQNTSKEPLLYYIHILNISFAGFRLLLVQCSRFLQHCTLRFALEYLEYTQKSTKINQRSFKKVVLRYFLSFI